MFQPIQISIPAEKYTEDVYIILEKLEGEIKTFENSRYYPEHGNKTYYASKALKETYIVTMPTQEQQTTVTCYGTNGKVVTPFEGLYFRTIEEVTEKIDDINNRLAKAIFLCCYREYKYNTIRKHEEFTQVLNSVTKANICEKLQLLIPEYIISDYIERLP